MSEYKEQLDRIEENVGLITSKFMNNEVRLTKDCLQEKENAQTPINQAQLHVCKKNHDEKINDLKKEVSDNNKKIYALMGKVAATGAVLSIVVGALTKAGGLW